MTRSKKPAGDSSPPASCPDHAGLPAQLVITLSLADLERRAGRATTHHGGTLTIDQALKLAADGKTLPAILDDAGGILAYGRSRRLASAGQRKALFARDRGCTFPGCTRTATQSEIHHTTDWALGGRTDLTTMAIACGYHNTEGPKQRGGLCSKRCFRPDAPAVGRRERCRDDSDTG